MSDGALRISILGDASQFTKTLAKLEAELKGFKEKLKTATGADIPTYNLKIAGAQEAIKEITSFGKFAEGTLGALNQQISELNRKKLTIQADAAALAPINQELDRLIKKRDELNKAGLAQPIIESVRPAAESIAGLRLRIQELNDLKILIDPKLNPSALAKINQEIDGLEDKVGNLETLGTGVGGAGNAAAKGLKNFEDQSRQSRIAVTNLALVLQDLPFGFIAIQNNLPNLQSSFANLKTTSDGTKNAFKAFAGALAGPGGFFLAFSAVTGAVTYAVQEYGSFSAAVDALFGKINPLKDTIDRIQKSYTEYNKQLQSNNEITLRATANQSGLIKTVELLSQKATDLSLSEKQRGAYLSQLKKIDEAYFGQLKTGASDVDAIKKATDAYTESLIANSTVKAYQSQLDAIEEQIAAQKTLREEFKESLKAAEQVKATTTKSFVDPTEKVNQDLGATATALDELYQKREKIVQGLNEAISGLKTVVKAPTGGDSGTKSFQFVLKLLEDFKISKGFYEFEKALDRLPKYADILLDIKKSEKERAEALKNLSNESIKIFGINNNLFENLKVGVSGYQALSTAVDEYGFLLQRAILDNERFTRSFNDLQPKSLVEFQKRFKEAKKEIDKFREENQQPNLPDVNPLKRLQGKIDESEAFRKGLAEDFENAKTVLTEVFFNPIGELFDGFLENGKFAFDEFGKSILKTIKSLVSRIIATGIINLLANILFPDQALASAALGKGSTGAGGGILGAFGAAFKSVLGIGKIANPNFGGVQGGGMQLAGEVVFRQRGSDLIGVINRTNGTINRVG